MPSCCLAEAASQPAERKESCASGQEIEQPGPARRQQGEPSLGVGMQQRAFVLRVGAGPASEGGQALAG